MWSLSQPNHNITASAILLRVRCSEALLVGVLLSLLPLPLRRVREGEGGVVGLIGIGDRGKARSQSLEHPYCRHGSGYTSEVG